MNNIDNHLWQQINNMFMSSNRYLQVYTEGLQDGIRVLNILQVTPKSTLGSIVLNTSEIVIDNWIRY